MLKKICGAILILAMAFSLAACDVDDYTAYKNAYDKTMKLTSFNCDYTMDMSMDVSGQKLSTKMSGNIKEKIENSKPKFIMDSTVDVAGQSQKMKIFSDGKSGYMSMNVGGLGDFLVDLGLKEEDLKKQTSQFELADFTKDMIKTIKSVKEDAGRRLTISLDGQKFGDKLKSILEEQLKNQIKSDKASLIKYTFSQIDLELLADKSGYISEQKLKFNVTVEIPKDASGTNTDIKSTADMNMSLKYIDLGKDVEVTLPDTSKAIKMDDLQKKFAGLAN